MQPGTFARVKYAYTHPPEHGGWQMGEGDLVYVLGPHNDAPNEWVDIKTVPHKAATEQGKEHESFTRMFPVAYLEATELAGEYGVITFGFSRADPIWRATDPHCAEVFPGDIVTTELYLVNGIPDEQWLHVVPVTNHASTVSSAGICPTNRVLLLSLAANASAWRSAAPCSPRHNCC